DCGCATDRVENLSTELRIGSAGACSCAGGSVVSGSANQNILNRLLRSRLSDKSPDISYRHRCPKLITCAYPKECDVGGIRGSEIDCGGVAQGSVTKENERGTGV